MYPDNTDSVAQDQIRAFVDRILRMKEERRAIDADIREIYAEAKGNGFDKTVLGKLVNYVEKRASDANALLEGESLFDLYLSAYDSASRQSGTVYATHAHEAEPEHDADGVIIETGEIQESQPAPQAARDGGQKLSVSSRAAAAIGSEDSASDVERTPSYRIQTETAHRSAIEAVGTGEEINLNANADGALSPVDTPKEINQSQPIQPETAAQTEPALAGPVIVAEHDAVESSVLLSEAADLDKSGAEQSASAPVPRKFKFSDTPHSDCLNPERCGGFSNLGLCPQCKAEAATARQIEEA